MKSITFTSSHSSERRTSTSMFSGKMRVYIYEKHLPSCRAKTIISQSKPLKRKEAIK